MRAARLTFLALLAAVAFTACTSSPTAPDDCAQTETCSFGHPGSGS